MIPYRPVLHSPGFYPITSFYLSAVVVLVFTVHGFFTLAQGVVLLAICGIGSILIAAWRDLKAVHTLVNGQRSEMLTEIADLEELAADCAEDGRYEFLYVAAPLKIAKAAGSPVNPVVIK